MSSGFWDVYAVDLNKQTVTNLTKVSANQNIELTAASASPDGKWCSYLAIPAANVKQRRLYLVSTAGGSAPKTLGPLGGVYGNNRWASDSSGLYFIHGTATKDRVLKYATVTGAVSTAVKTYAGTDLLILAAE